MQENTPIHSILIDPARQRQEFDPQALQDLADSIEQYGLFHALVVRETPQGPKLVAGERRLRAVTQLWELGSTVRYNGYVLQMDCVPTVTLGELDEYSATEAELEENIRRRDLTWQEHANAVKTLHELRASQALDRGLQHTVAETAMEVHGRSDGRYHDDIRKEIVIANNLGDKEVAGAKTANEAFKILKRKEELARVTALGAQVGATLSASSHKLLQGNCLAFMAAWAADPVGSRFDVILTDPPYGMDAQDFGDAGGKMTGIEHHYKDDEEHFQQLMGQWCGLSYLVARPLAHAYVCCDIDQFAFLRAAMRSAGWYVFRTPFINFKQGGSGRVPLPQTGPRRSWEAILYAIKGDRPVNFIAPDVILSYGDENLGHGAQKPVNLYTELLKRSVRPGDNVLDSFAGTGTIFPAAHELKCYATGIEQNSASYGMCVERLGRLP